MATVSSTYSENSNWSFATVTNNQASSKTKNIFMTRRENSTRSEAALLDTKRRSSTSSLDSLDTSSLDTLSKMDIPVLEFLNVDPNSKFAISNNFISRIRRSSTRSVHVDVICTDTDNISKSPFTDDDDECVAVWGFDDKLPTNDLYLQARTASSPSFLGDESTLKKNRTLSVGIYDGFSGLEEIPTFPINNNKKEFMEVKPDESSDDSDEDEPSYPSNRRRGSVTRVAKRWRLTEDDAAELMINFERAQSFPPLDWTIPFNKKRKNKDIQFFYQNHLNLMEIQTKYPKS